MNTSEWGIVIGMATSAVLALGPWMFMVHAKLAVVVAQMTRLTAKVDELVEADQARLPRCIRHDAALDEYDRRIQTHDVQLAHVAERLREVD